MSQGENPGALLFAHSKSIPLSPLPFLPFYFFWQENSSSSEIEV